MKLGWEALAERHGARAGDDLAQFEWVKDNMLGLIEHRTGSPQTLAHGDFHPENVLFIPGPRNNSVLIDWQFSIAGPSIYDVSMFIISSLSVEERRTHEDSLLRTYHDLLTTDANFHYSYDEMYFDYRASATFVMFKALLKASWIGTPNVRPDIIDIADAVFERALAAVQDLNPVEALKEALVKIRS